MSRSRKPVVIITGVSSGIGLAAATLFAQRGWLVVGTVRSRGKAAALRTLPVDVQLADMLKPRDLERVVTTARQTYGRIDALICNAGYGLTGAIDTLDYAAMQEQLAVNMLAPAELIRHVVPIMKQQGGGVIVGVSSIVGRVGFSGYSLYSASKFGLEGLFESLAIELLRQPIRFKLVEPSGVRTSFWTSLKSGGKNTNQSRNYGANSALTPEGVAAVLYRATQDSSQRLRYPIGQTRYMNVALRLLPERMVLGAMRRYADHND